VQYGPFSHILPHVKIYYLNSTTQERGTNDIQCAACSTSTGPYGAL